MSADDLGPLPMRLQADPTPLACLGASPRGHRSARQPVRLGVYAWSVLGTPAIAPSFVNGADDVVDGGRTAGNRPRDRRR